LLISYVSKVAYEVEEYQTAEGKKPFSEWLSRLPDKTVQAKLLARINRASLGNLRDWKALKDTSGLCEMREHYGSGFRVYFKIVGTRLLLLLAGSTKRDQDATIAKAKKYLEDYEQRRERKQ
jgi:putative addiction module killer protein